MIQFKYLDKVPLFNRSIYSLKGKKAKRRSISEILSRYRFDNNKVYTIDIYNPRYKKLNIADISNLSLLEAWPVCAECAEYRSIYILNNEICFDYFIIDNKEFIIDLGFVYQEESFDYGDKVKSSFSDEEFYIDFPLIKYEGDPFEYSRDFIINSTIDKNFDFDMHYYYKDEYGVIDTIYPSCSLKRV